jgi:hypothetical protein
MIVESLGRVLGVMGKSADISWDSSLLEAMLQPSKAARSGRGGREVTSYGVERAVLEKTIAALLKPEAAADTSPSEEEPK